MRSTDGTDGSVLDVLKEQNTKGNEAVKARLPVTPVTNRSSAETALEEWSDSAQDFVDGQRQWLQGNFNEFYGYCSGNPRLGLAEGETASLTNNAFGNAITEGGAWAIKEAIKRAPKGGVVAALAGLGSGVAPGVGTAIGFVAGVVIEYAAGKIFEYITGKTDSDQSASDASQRTAELIQARNESFETQASHGKAEVRATKAAVKKCIAGAEDQAVVDEVTAWAQREKTASASPKTQDRTLSKRLLQRWVLAHAGDEEDANKDTSETDWERAAKKAFGKKNLDGRPDVFAWQSKQHWFEVGLDNPDTDYMIKRAKKLKKEEDPAAAAVERYDGMGWRFDSTSQPQRLIRLIDDNHIATELSPKGKECIRNGDFNLNCKLDLTTSDGACFVDHWDYKLQLTGPIEAGSHGTTSFSVSPD